jgi:hypothetical protein
MGGAPPKPRRRTGDELSELQHPLLGDNPTLQLLPPRDAVGARTRCLKRPTTCQPWAALQDSVAASPSAARTLATPLTV